MLRMINIVNSTRSAAEKALGAMERREEAMTDANPRKSDQKSQYRKTGLSRRSLVAATAAGAALPLIAGRGVWAADAEHTIPSRIC